MTSLTLVPSSPRTRLTTSSLVHFVALHAVDRTEHVSGFDAGALGRRVLVDLDHVGLPCLVLAENDSDAAEGAHRLFVERLVVRLVEVGRVLVPAALQQSLDRASGRRGLVRRIERSLLEKLVDLVDLRSPRCSTRHQETGEATSRRSPGRSCDMANPPMNPTERMMTLIATARMTLVVLFM